MSTEIYEILSLAMRYWFTALGVLIVWRSFSWLRKDRRLKHKRLRQLPDAGMIGELVVLQDAGELEAGTIISIPREGVLGFLRSNDVVVPADGVAAQHIDFAFVSGQGVRMYPRRGCTCSIDGAEISDRRSAKAHPMLHGSEITIGDAVLRLRIFAGLDVPSLPPEPGEIMSMPPLQGGPFYSVSQPYPPQPMQPVQQPYAPPQASYPTQQPIYPAQQPYPPQQVYPPSPLPEESMNRSIRRRRYSEDE